MKQAVSVCLLTQETVLQIYWTIKKNVICQNVFQTKNDVIIYSSNNKMNSCFYTQIRAGTELNSTTQMDEDKLNAESETQLKYLHLSSRALLIHVITSGFKNSVMSSFTYSHCV